MHAHRCNTWKFTPVYTQGLLLAVFEGLYVVLETESGLATCKAKLYFLSILVCIVSAPVSA